ncbi:MAG: hypothetical protein ACT4TC_04450 [Myxococcaceae bacterium]
MSPSPREVEQRLAQVGELYRLSLSLRQTRGRLLTQDQLLRRSLLVLGSEPGPAEISLEDGERFFRVKCLGSRRRVGEEYGVLFSPGSLNGAQAHVVLLRLCSLSGAWMDSLAQGEEGSALLQWVGWTPSQRARATPLQAFALGDRHAFELAGGVINS